MANLGAGAAGAASGFAAGGPVGSLLAGLGGLFGGGGGQMSAAQQAAIKQQRAIANQLYNYGNSSPMTNQQDLNNLAQSQGIQGQSERSNMGSLAAFGNPSGVSTGGANDQMANLQQNDSANRMALGEQHMADAIAARRSALLEASGVNQQAYNMASGPGATPPNNLGQSLSGVAQAYAYNKANKGGGEVPDGTSSSDAVSAGNASPFPSTNPIPQPYDPFASLQGGAGSPNGTAGSLNPPGAGGGMNPHDTSMWNLGQGMAGAGDAPAQPQPKHDPMMHAMSIIHQIIAHHLDMAKLKAKSKDKPKRKRKPSSAGAGDAPAMPLPGYTASGMASPQSPPGMQGAGARGNEPGGENSVRNQTRRPQEAMLNRLSMPGGLQFPS